MVTYKIFVTQDSTKTQDSTLLYRGWLKHTMNRDLKRFFNANTWPSFLISLISFLNTWLSFSNSRTNFWFSFKTSKAQWASVSKNRTRVFKYVLSQAFCLREFVKVWSVRSTTYSLKYNLIVCNLLVTKSSWSYSLKH